MEGKAVNRCRCCGDPMGGLAVLAGYICERCLESGRWKDRGHWLDARCRSVVTADSAAACFYVEEPVETTEMVPRSALVEVGDVTIRSKRVCNGCEVAIDGVPITGLLKAVLTLEMDCVATLKIERLVTKKGAK